MDVLSLYKDELDKTSKVVANARSGQLTDPTPCSDFDVRALINHMCLGNHYIAQGGGADGPEYERDFLGDDHVAAYERSREAVWAKLAEPGALESEFPFPGGMPMTGDQALTFVLLDGVVHRWDLAKATGQDPDIDVETAATLLERLKPMVPDEMRAAAPELTTRSIPFGPAIDTPESASAVDKLLAFLGRDPR